jgi:hypothetical protein
MLSVVDAMVSTQPTTDCEFQFVDAFGLTCKPPVSSELERRDESRLKTLEGRTSVETFDLSMVEDGVGIPKDEDEEEFMAAIVVRRLLFVRDPPCDPTCPRESHFAVSCPFLESHQIFPIDWLRRCERCDGRRFFCSDGGGSSL